MLRQSRRVIIEHSTALESCQASPSQIRPEGVERLTAMGQGRAGDPREWAAAILTWTSVSQLESDAKQRLLHSLYLWILPAVTE